LTSYFIFEFKSNADPQKIQEDLLEIWSASEYGWFINIFQKKHETLVCEALYYFHNDPNCRGRIERVLSYLFNITTGGVYYYRFIEAMDVYGKYKRRINLNQMLTKYYPTMGGYGIRHEVQRFETKVPHNSFGSAN
jgi:hypothetical protein